MPYGINNEKGSKICGVEVKVLWVGESAYNWLFVEAVLYRYREGIAWGDLR